jgi:predicted DNA-binding mobile mystery protein A
MRHLRPAERSTQARRELDRTFAAADLGPIRPRPSAGWIRTIREALAMSQAALAGRLGISAAAVNKLEHAEAQGGITTAKLAEVAAALDSELVYVLVPKRTLEQTVVARAMKVATEVHGYSARTSPVETQAIETQAIETEAIETEAIESNQERGAVYRYANELIASGKLWRSTNRSG